MFSLMHNQPCESESFGCTLVFWLFSITEWFCKLARLKQELEYMKYCFESEFVGLERINLELLQFSQCLQVGTLQITIKGEVPIEKYIYV